MQPQQPQYPPDELLNEPRKQLRKQLRKELRKKLRQHRKSLSTTQLRQAERAILSHCHHAPVFQAAQRIGLYLQSFNEISTTQLMMLLSGRGKQLYLPRILSCTQTLTWVRVSLAQLYQRRFARHVLGMREPYHQRGLPVDRLDVLLMPLVGVDRQGYRMGMGGGFYDRTLALAPCKPFRIGLAHDFQQVPDTFPEPWDQRLDAVLSPKGWQFFAKSRVKAALRFG